MTLPSLHNRGNLKFGDADFYNDLILYNFQLHTYDVIELKGTSSKPRKYETNQFIAYMGISDKKRPKNLL